MNFYTQNGWKGDNYDTALSVKDISEIIRTHVKKNYPAYKFSVTKDGKTINIALMEAQEDVFEKGKAPDDGHVQGASAYFRKESWETHNTVLSETAIKVLKDVEKFANSYNYNDSDGQIDYFDYNFTLRIDIGKYDTPFKVVDRHIKPKTSEDKTNFSSDLEYEIIEDVHTQTGEKLFVVKIKNKVSKEEYIEISKQMKTLGAYYSKYKHGFIFKENPKNILPNGDVKQQTFNSEAAKEALKSTFGGVVGTFKKKSEKSAPSKEPATEFKRKTHYRTNEAGKTYKVKGTTVHKKSQ